MAATRMFLRFALTSHRSDVVTKDEWIECAIRSLDMPYLYAIYPILHKL